MGQPAGLEDLHRFMPAAHRVSHPLSQRLSRAEGGCPDVPVSIGGGTMGQETAHLIVKQAAFPSNGLEPVDLAFRHA